MRRGKDLMTVPLKNQKKMESTASYQKVARGRLQGPGSDDGDKRGAVSRGTRQLKSL
ncbi:MAG: hypothetical protein ACR2L2_04465 [Acidobacteriota bacterium]